MNTVRRSFNELSDLIRSRGASIRQPPACMSCGGEEWVLLSARTRDRSDFAVLGCCACGLGRLDPVPTSTFSYYEVGYRDDFGQGGNPAAVRAMPVKVADTERRLRELKPVLGAQARVLDVGCGSGALLHRCRDEGGPSVAGVEPDQRFRDILVAEGFDVRKTLSEFAGERFDAVLLLHVLEHVEEPVGFLRGITKHLAERGLLVIEVPCLADPLLWVYQVPAFWQHYWQFPHIWYFSPDPIRRIVERAGFQVDALDLLQRYGLANHLSWLNVAHGSDERFAALAPEDVDRGYRHALIRNGTADTLWMVCRVRGH